MGGAAGVSHVIAKVLQVADAGMPEAWLDPPHADHREQVAVDTEAYLRRIRYDGSLAPTAETLGAIAAHHAAAIPFENLDPLLRVPVRLDLAALQAKLVGRGRGGYCFEHNLLLAHVLSALGYRVRGLAARVLWNAPEGAHPPRGHMLLLVDLGTPHVVDVGFGGLTLTSALRLEPDVEQATAHEPFRLLEAEGGYTMQARLGRSWKTLYRFDLQPQFLADYQVTNWYLSNHPESHFLRGLIAARAAPDRRYALRNSELAVHHLDGRTERRALTTPQAIREVLELDFRLTLPDTANLDPAFEHILGTAVPPAANHHRGTKDHEREPGSA